MRRTHYQGYFIDLTRGNHPFSVRQGNRNRFFNKHMLTMFSCLHRHLCVELMGGSDMNGFNRRVVKQLIVGKMGDPLENILKRSS